MNKIAKVGIITVSTERHWPSVHTTILDELIVVTNSAVQQICLSKENQEYFQAISEIPELHSCTPKVKVLYHSWINIKESILEGDTFSTLVHLLLSNETFRKSFLVEMRHHSSALNCGKVALPCMKVRVVMPKKSEIGYKSQALASKKLWELIELEDAMHWLSTLGGAYSNLGEHSLAFAHRACDNAFRQMKIALRSDDPFVIYRCWLYVAMSSMQQGRLYKSRRIIEITYQKFSCNNEIDRRKEDDKIGNMCLGIWARLQFVWNSKLKRRRRPLNNKRTNDL